MSELLRDSTEISDSELEANTNDRWMVSYANLMTLVFGFFFLFCFITIKDKFAQEQKLKILSQQQIKVTEQDFMLQKLRQQNELLKAELEQLKAISPEVKQEPQPKK